MSVQAPVVAIAFGTVAPPQGDIVELNLHLGCTDEVSSFEAVLHNFDGKFSPAAGNDGTITGATWVAGHSGSALSFNGTTDYVSIADAASLNFGTGNFSVSLWLKMDTISKWYQMVSKRINGGTGWELELAPSNYLAFVVEKGDGDSYSVYSPSAVQAGVWYHVVMVFANNNQMRLYVNAITGTPTAVTSTVNTNASRALRIGYEEWTNFYDGIVDEVQVYNRALSQSEITALFNNGHTAVRSGLVGEWLFDENTGTTAHDTSHTPITVGSDGNLSVGRGANCPLLMTCRVETVKYESTSTENYVHVSGRCWGERLFRRVVTKSYANVKGEDIVKDLLDYYVGLSHVRSGTELVEATDTTYTSLAYEDTPVIDILRYVAESADQQGTIGYDFRVAPDGKFEFFPRNSKTSSVSLSERVEQCEYSQDVHRVRNKITAYGATDKSVPANKVAWTDSLTPTDGNWTAIAGTVSLEVFMGLGSDYSIETHVDNLEFGECLFTLNSGHIVNADLYPELRFGIQKETVFDDRYTVMLFDTSDRRVCCQLSAGSPGDGGVADQWSLQTLKVGSANADSWVVQSGFDWTQVWRFGVACYCSGGSGTGSFWVGRLFFGGRRYASVQEDAASQTSYGLRELVEVNEELWSDLECEGRAEALLSNLKDPAESLTLKSAVLDYGGTPILAGDSVHVQLPVEGVDADFRVLSVEYRVDGAAQTLEVTLELGREAPLLADYVMALRAKTDSLSRYKLGKRG